MVETAVTAQTVGALSSISLAAVLDQSVDCVKLISLSGQVEYMNGNGLCAMEIDDFCAVQGQLWAHLWPEDARPLIDAAYVRASGGEAARFHAFCPTAKGTPRWWDVTVSPVNDDAGTLAAFLSVSRDVTESRAATEALATAAAELKHRLKNTYTMIASLLTGFARGDEANTRFAREMADRLGALSRAQSLFVSDDARGDTALLISALLAPFSTSVCPVVFEEAASHLIDQPQANAIALVIGELSVNSSKHGALAHGGDVRVCVEAADGRLAIIWSETSLCPVAAHHRDGGQGIRLMDRIVRARGGTIGMEWKPFGLDVTLTLPIAR